LATIHLQLRFTGAPVTGDLTAEARLLGRSEGTALRQSLSAATISANGKTVLSRKRRIHAARCAAGRYPRPAAMASARSPRKSCRSMPANSTPPSSRSSKPAMPRSRKASPQVSFIEHFWGGVPRRSARGAEQPRADRGRTSATASGHVQGGALLGLAATSARAAAPAEMMLGPTCRPGTSAPGRGRGAQHPIARSACRPHHRRRADRDQEPRPASACSRH